MDSCDCPVDVMSLSIAQAETFIELTASVFARADASACVEGNDRAGSVAFTNCAAVAYAKVWTYAFAEAILETGLTIIICYHVFFR